MVGDGGSSAGSYLADPTSPIPSHCAVITLFGLNIFYFIYMKRDWAEHRCYKITLFESVPVHQLSRLAL